MVVLIYFLAISSICVSSGSVFVVLFCFIIVTPSVGGIFLFLCRPSNFLLMPYCVDFIFLGTTDFYIPLTVFDLCSEITWKESSFLPCLIY